MNWSHVYLKWLMGVICLALSPSTYSQSAYCSKNISMWVFVGLKVCIIELIYSSLWTYTNHMSCILKNLLSSNLPCKNLKVIPLHIFVDQYKAYYYVHLPTMKHWKQIVLLIIFLPLSTLNTVEGSTFFQHLCLYKELHLMNLPIQMVLF
jgi:hypothetical protein